MGVDPLTLRPFIALFWNPVAVAPPPPGQGLNSRVRITLKGQYLYGKGQRLSEAGRRVVKAEVKAFVKQAGGSTSSIQYDWRWGAFSFELAYATRKAKVQKRKRTSAVLEHGAQFLW